jgi:DNA polymerase I-like protein with 3'-5' exonuclease and polymerase domains
MNVITLDFETYYDAKFSLSRLTTEEYVCSPEFEIIGVGVKLNQEKSKWISGTHEEITKELQKYPWRDSMLLCHNTMFDASILAWVCYITPYKYLDTLCMARALHGVDSGGSLKALAERYKIGVKGEEVLNAKGKRRADFSAEELARYGEYCLNDVELTRKLFNKMAKHIPEKEVNLIDLTLRMFTHPTLYLNIDLLTNRLTEISEEKFELLSSLKNRLNCKDEEEVRKKLSSNKQFAEVLESVGVTVPTKTSSRTGKDTYALAKNDEEFIALTEHKDPFVQRLCTVRLGTKSTIEESRIQRFIEIATRNGDRVPIPLKYYGAHTGRWSGLDKVNFQNLPSRDKKKKTLKNAVVAPEGYVVVNSDSSQIEARVLAWLAGQDDLVEMFTEGRDVYSEFATKIYKQPISKANPIERFVGKTCILGLGYGTGALKLKHTLKTQPPGADLTIDRCKEIVNIYRTENSNITDLWDECGRTLTKMASENIVTKTFIGKHKCVSVTNEGVRLPSGLLIRYPNLHLDTNETSSKMVYDSRKGSVSIWGGAMVENIVQGIARCVVAEQMLLIAERYRPALTVHDSVVCVLPEDEIDEGTEFIVQCMMTTPEWAPGLPVACEAKHGKTYGDC